MEYLADAAHACGMAGGTAHAWALARQGLGHARAPRNVAWARLVSYDHERRAAEDREHPGIPLDSPERREAARILRAAALDPVALAPMEAVFDSREEVYSSANLFVLIIWAGEYARCLPLLHEEAEAAVSRGQLARAVRCWAMVAQCDAALGRLDEARQALEETDALSARLGQPMFIALHAREQLALALDEGWDELAPIFGSIADSASPASSWALGINLAIATRTAAVRGDAATAYRFLDLLVPWLERAPVWSIGFPVMASHAAEALWLLAAVRHAGEVERCLRDKVLVPDFRIQSVDGRLALARICALTGRHDEATSWFAEARRVLTEQGARPLLAVCDFDEALMYVRRAGTGDAERARPLLQAARRQFEAIGMTGWIRRAEELSV
jgi:tetratricopeptide (TPR) repeat protein